MTEEMKQRLERESHALAELCDRIDRAVDCMIKTGMECVDQDGAAFVSDDVLTRFNIDPNHDFMILDTINDRLAERPEVLCFDTDMEEGRSGYRIQFEAQELAPSQPQPRM